MAKKRKSVIVSLIIFLFALSCVAFIIYPWKFTSEEIDGLNKFYELSNAECDMFDELRNGDISNEDWDLFMTEWISLTDLDHEVNYEYIRLNPRQKWYVRFHTSPPVNMAVVE